jgi:hypothetical protein
MTDIDDRDGNDPLLRSLRALQRPIAPANDLWPLIATRIATGQAPVARVPRRLRLAPMALVASLVIAVLMVHQLTHRSHGVQDQLIAEEAQGMTREYAGAMRVLTASAPNRTADTAELQVLDRSAAQIRNALRRDPDARFLLDRLQHTYALRLALTQRAAMS